MAMTEAQLVTQHQDLVRRIASKYQNYGVPAEDLVQEGMIGLLRAIRTFDASKGAALPTWASFHVRSQIRGVLGLDDKGGSQERQSACRDSRRSNYRPLGMSLSEPVGEDGGSLIDFCPTQEPWPSNQVEAKETAEHLEKALRVLRPVELDVITQRFVNDVTLEEAGNRLGVNRESARQIQVKALGRLEKALAHVR